VLLEPAHWANEFIYDSLLEWDPKINIRPALAESYKVKDVRTIDFTLKKGVKFHNGQELTSEDVAYSLQMRMNPPRPDARECSRSSRRSSVPSP